MPASHDLFISYRWADRPSVEALVAALRARGVRVWQDAREVEDLASIHQAVATGLANSRALLAWYSDKYNLSRACQWELTSAYIAAQSGGDPRLRVLVVNPEASNAHVHLPELFDQLHLSGAGVRGDPTAVQALADRVQVALRQVPLTFLGELRSTTPPLWLPAMGTGSTRFVGRLREMWQLHGALQAGHAAMLTGTNGRSGLAIVRGAGGIGKSLMVEEYALRFGAAYPGGVFWLRAFGHPDGDRELDAIERSALRDSQVVKFAAHVGIDTANLSSIEVRVALERHFDKSGLPFLWVVDDLPHEPGPEGLRGWQAPHPLGCTVVTTRTRRFGHVATIELPRLAADDARRLLTRQRQLSPTETTTADTICDLLGHHALAVDVTAALVGRRGLVPVLEVLRHPDRDALDLAAQLEEALPNDHQRHIAATFLSSIKQLDDCPRELLRHAALLGAAPIPRQLLLKIMSADRWARTADEGILTDVCDKVDLATSRLLSASLAEDAGDGAIAVHTLVSRTVRFAWGSPHVGPVRRAFDGVMGISDAICATQRFYRAHVLRVLTDEMIRAAGMSRNAELASWVSHAREMSESPNDPQSTELLGRVALHDFASNSYERAKLGFERQLEASRLLLGDEHPDTLTAKVNLARTMFEQRDLPGARQLQEETIETLKRLMGDEHPATLATMGFLAITLCHQGDLSGARRLQETVLEAMKRILGDEAPHTLAVMSHLAITLICLGDLPGACRLQEAVLEARKRLLGDEDPLTLAIMAELAETMLWLDNPLGAARLQEVVLDARRRLLGDEDPLTLATMAQLAETMLWLGDLPNACRLQVAVLVGRKRLSGAERLDILALLGQLIDTLSIHGDLPGAQRMREVVLEARKRLLGDENPVP